MYGSILDAYSNERELLDRAKELGLTAFAITDHGNMASCVYFDKIKKDYPNIKLIHGCELYECFDMTVKDKTSKYFHLIALARNEDGRKILNALITKSYTNGFYYKPRVSLDIFKDYDCSNLVVLSGCLASKLSRTADYQQCTEYITEYKSLFANFYLEMQSHATDEQAIYNKKILQLSLDTNTPFVITTDSHYARTDDAKYQEILIKIGRNQKGDNQKDEVELAEVYNGCYLQSIEEIHKIMDSQIGAENVTLGLANTNAVADLTDIVNMPFQKPILPDFETPPEFTAPEDYLRFLTKQGWNSRGFDNFDDIKQAQYRERLEYELKIICEMGFAGYFLIIFDVCRYADSKGMARAAGRGSAAGSLVCYLLKITNLDPIKYNLIFERFLNPERISLPDVDSDMGDRDAIIRYMEDRYGKERVCQIANFVFTTPLTSILDVGRMLKMPYNSVQKISEYFKVSKFEQAFEITPDLKEKFAEHMELFETAEKISGRVRGISQHAGGVCVAKTPLSDYMPCKTGKNGEQVIQVDKRFVEEIGLVKFDILGVETLNIVQETVKDSGLTLWDIDINNATFENDKNAYELLGEAKTNAVFQLESSGMKDLLIRLKPKNIEELSAILALYRPDTMPMLEKFIECKHNPSKTSYVHDDMIPILENTYSCLIYQEQVMDIVRKFGGRTYGGADVFRKAIGKKDKDLVKQEVDKLRLEITGNGYEKEISDKICDILVEMGGYCFNRSHSAAYAVLSLQTAYIKAHYPLQFMKALLNSKKDNNGKLNKYLIDAKDCAVTVLPPHINKSSNRFEIVDNKILFGLSAINGLGESVTCLILNERETGGLFKNLNDLLNRVNLNITQITAIIKSGAIPTKDKEKCLLNYCNSLYEKRVFKPLKTIPMNLVDLELNFGIREENKEERLRLYNIAKEKEFNKLQNEKYEKHMKNFSDKYLIDKDFWEFQALSVFIDNNPFESIYGYVLPFDDAEDDSSAVVVGIISNIQKKTDRNSKKYAYIQLYSAFGIIEVMCWNQQYVKYMDLLFKGNKIAIKCKKKDNKAFAGNIKTYEQWLKDTEDLRKAAEQCR